MVQPVAFFSPWVIVLSGEVKTQSVARLFRVCELREHSARLQALVGEEDELEEDVEQCLSCLEGVLEVE